MANTKDTYPTPELSGRKNPKKAEGSGTCGKGTGRCCGEFCVFRPFPRVPLSPLSNYNQIKDRVSVARHHWGV
jgi:hypothetical protein